MTFVTAVVNGGASTTTYSYWPNLTNGIGRFLRFSTLRQSGERSAG